MPTTRVGMHGQRAARIRNNTNPKFFSFFFIFFRFFRSSPTSRGTFREGSRCFKKVEAVDGLHNDTGTMASAVPGRPVAQYITSPPLNYR